MDIDSIVVVVTNRLGHGHSIRMNPLSSDLVIKLLGMYKANICF
ncbi:hypothetical protein ACE3MZ_07215 [Paenibacillus sp. WLX1005]